MQDVQALPRSPLIELWRERAPVTIVAVSGILLAVGLFALIWTVIYSAEPRRHAPDIIQLLLVRTIPTNLPPPPAKETVQRIDAPPPIPVPPKKPVEQRRDSIAAVRTPKPKPAPPEPKTRSASVADPLSLDAPPDWRQYALPQGANSGTVIGGNGENGGGSGCGGAGAYLPIITSQITSLFSHDAKMDDRTFHIQAQLWFDELGAVQRSQLLQSAGRADLDASIRTLLGKINVGRGMPRCIQPIAVWVNQPAEGSVGAGRDHRNSSIPAGAQTETWQSRPKFRN